MTTTTTTSTTASAVPTAPVGDATPQRRRGASRIAGQNKMPWPLILAFLAPALLVYGLFLLYPIAQSTRYSMFSWNGLEPLDNFVGIDNFRRAFSDPMFRDALRHNTIIVVLSLAFQIPFALAMAMLLNARLRGRAILRTLFFAPYVLSEVVTGVVWRQILRPDGMLDQILGSIGAESLVQEWLADPDFVLYSLFVVISWKYFGFHMILLLAGLQQIPKELGEAASIDGASAWQRFRYVTLPLLGPTLRVSIFLSVIGALQLFDLVWVTTKGGPIAAIAEGDTVVFDVEARELNVELDAAEIERRVAAYEPPPPRYSAGVLGRYARHVGSAAAGALLD